LALKSDSAATKIVISGKNLRKAFDGVIAIDDVSFGIEEGTVTALIGPNGSGKTTLLDLVTGFLSPDRGEIYLCDQKITALPPHEIAGLGVSRTFQDLRLLNRLSVLDNVLLAYPNQRNELFLNALFSNSIQREEARNREAAFQLLESGGLSYKADDLTGSLSYGQQKVLSLVCCLATSKKIVLLDEPVAGVSPEMSAKIIELLLAMKAGAKTIVLVEHDIQAVRKAADQVLVMDDGRVIAAGLKEKVLGRPEIIEAYLT